MPSEYYGSVFAICSAAGSLEGIYASDCILKKYKRQSKDNLLILLRCSREIISLFHINFEVYRL